MQRRNDLTSAPMKTYIVLKEPSSNNQMYK